MERLKQEDTKPIVSTPSPLASPLPSTGTYTDYILYSAPSTAQTGWRYNIMKFGALGEKAIDPTSSQFLKPVKLNRKDPRTVRRLTEEDRERINKRILARNGMDVDRVKQEEGAVKDEDGKPLGGKKEKEQIDLSLVGVGKSGLQSKVRSKNSMFKKKIKRVFVSSEEARRLKREEWMPWVLEDDEGNERWIGRLEGGTGERPSNAPLTAAQVKQAKADAAGTGMKGWRPPPAPSEAGGGGSSYVAFVNDPQKDGFQVVPVHRWYKFSQGAKHVTLGGDEAETEYERLQKNQEADRWVMHKRNNPSGSSTPKPDSNASSSSKPKPTTTSTTSSSSTESNSLIRSRLLASSLASSRPSPSNQRNTKFKSVISTTTSGEGDDDDEIGGGAGGRRKKDGGGGGGGEQGDDEFDWDEEFQDDEEGIALVDDLADEGEVKELEERIKREMRGANRYEGVPEQEDDEEEGGWEELLTSTGKEMKKLVKRSDRTGAYDSEEEEEEGESSDAASTTSTSSLKPNSTTSTSTTKDPSRPSSSRPSSSSQRHSRKSDSRHPSRAASPSSSGSALVAKRATSPTGSASGSGRKSRGSSPAGSASGGGGGKRKRDGEESAEGKRRKAEAGGGGGAGGTAGLITEADLIALFKLSPTQSLTTQDVLSHFKRHLKADGRNRSNIAGLLQSVANLVEGKLVLKGGN